MRHLQRFGLLALMAMLMNAPLFAQVQRCVAEATGIT